MNVSETDGELRISLDLPGVDQSSIDVTVDGDMLTIRATRSAERETIGKISTSWSGISERTSVIFSFPST